MNQEHVCKAILVRGLTYFLGNTRFDKGVPVPITATQRAILEKDAYDSVSRGNAEDGQDVENDEVSKFDFVDLDEEVEGAEADKVEVTNANATRTTSRAPRKTPAR